MKLLLLSCALMLTACAHDVPIAASCPPPPPVPTVLTEPPSTGPSLSERYEALMQAFRNSLTKAAAQ